MTIQELHYSFHLAMDTIGGNGKRSFSISEVDWFLNKAQDYILNEYIKEFETDLKRTNELSTIHVKWPLEPFISPISKGAVNGVNVYEVLLNSLQKKYRSYTRLSATLTDGTCDYKAYGRYMDNDDINDALRNSFDFNEESFFFNIGQSTVATANTRNDKSIYIYSKYLIKNLTFSMEYIREPKRMSLGGYTYIDNTISVIQECELPNQLHVKLVDMAVMLAFNALNDQAYNIKKDIVSIQS